MRLFIALPLTKEARDFVGDNSKHLFSKLGDKAKFIPDYKWHFTLVFLGSQPEDTQPLERAIEKTAKEMERPEIRLEKVIYAPPRRKLRMVWLVSDEKSNERMAEINKKLVENLKKEGVEWREDKRPFNGHINLAKFEPTFIDELPEIESRVDFSYKPPSIELMKSTLKPTGAEYETIFEIPFRNN